MTDDLADRLQNEGEGNERASPFKSLTFSLDPVPPFRLDLTVWVLRRRPDNAVDLWDGRTYRRTVVLEGEPVGIDVTQIGPPEEPRLQVAATGHRLPAGVQQTLSKLLERMLGTTIDLSPFYRLVADDARLGPLVARFHGVRPPRFPTLFEAVLNGVACQQVTLTQGIRLLNRLVESYGIGVDEPGEPRSFPRPEDLATVDPGALRGLGLSHQKARATVELAYAISSGQLDLEGLAEAGDQEAVSRLLSLRGVGRWTAEYVLLRGLGRVHVFPGDDVGARNNLQRWLNLPGPPDYEEIQRLLARWSPYQGLVYFHLLLGRLTRAGSYHEEGNA